MVRRALITGITGQDGSYLAEFLLGKGYEVHGLVRRCSITNMDRIRHLLGEIETHDADLIDQFSLIRVLEQVRPAEVYNLAAQSFVPNSFTAPILTGETTGLGVLRMLEAIRHVDLGIRFYQASSSEMFGKARAAPQTEETPFHPRSPYGVSKVFGHHITVNYRESYGLHASSGILFNHESERRGIEFVTRKISMHVALIKAGLVDHLTLGRIDVKRDWGHAEDYVEAMWSMLQQDEPGDYVVATGEEHSVQEFCEIAFARVDLDWRDYVRCSDSLERPAEVVRLCGDASKARERLGWSHRVSFEGLVQRMVDGDVERVKANPQDIHKAGFWYL